MRSPFLFTMSIMFNAMMVGMCSSNSCVVRYRFRSRLVASMMLMMASGLSFTKYCRVTTSSMVYGERE